MYESILETVKVFCIIFGLLFLADIANSLAILATPVGY